jgi:hypothetical protein
MALASPPAVTCAPSAHPSESLPLALVVGPPILEYHAGPGAFVAVLRSATKSRPMTHALHMLHVQFWLTSGLFLL